MYIIFKMHSFKLLVIYLTFCTFNTISLSLNGKWKGYILNKNISFIAEVPGGIYSDLENNQLIPKNLVGFNDVNNRWVANESIIYKTDIEVTHTFLNTSHVVLIFYGLDTFSTIYINDVEIGKTSNMFLRYSFDIKNQLKSGKNELKVIFESSVKVAESLYNIQSENYVVPPKCVPNEYNGECHVNHIRKMQASYGWDWGPAFPSMGIWKNVNLMPVQNLLVIDTAVDLLKEDDLWQVTVTVFFETFGEKNTVINKLVHVKCSLDDRYSNESKITNLIVKNNQAYTTVIIKVPSNEVITWWPNGYGVQKLYLLNVNVNTDGDVFKKDIKVGFRTVELVQEKLEKGMSFFFKINGVPIFAKGSNWIPSSIFPEYLSRQNIINNLLKSAKDTYMNMLRVWGGGVYESDDFYDLADEYGIMIWQDFMFACNMYPATTFYLNNVKEEVIQNMRRLKHHSSIVLWAGNNENEAALYGNWYGTGSEQVYKNDYVKLYVNTIKTEATKIDSSRPFVVSSPSNGLYSEENNYTESNPYSNLYGDVHYYNYLKNGWDINQYPITRFASEYGFQALPSIWTFMSASKHSSDLQLDSSFMKHRQHLPHGNNFMKLLISKNFIIPKSNDTVRNLVDYIYLSQVTQAVSMKIQTELYRLMKSFFNDIGEGLTMGALYWQLNDVWQAPSWSSIDFSGRWKMLHYFVKDFFSPLIITSRLTRARELYIYIVSDLLHKLENLTVEINIYEWKSSKSINTIEITNITIESNESRLIVQYWIDILLERAGCGSLETAKENCMVELVLKDTNGLKIAPPNYVYPHPLKQVSLPNDSITVNIQPKTEKLNELEFEVKITSPKLALFVWLEIGNISGRFSENGFHILERIKTITFHAYETVTVQTITKNLLITSLSRIYDSNLRTADVKIVVSELIKSNQF